MLTASCSADDLAERLRVLRRGKVQEVRRRDHPRVPRGLAQARHRRVRRQDRLVQPVDVGGLFFSLRFRFLFPSLVERVLAPVLACTCACSCTCARARADRAAPTSPSRAPRASSPPRTRPTPLSRPTRASPPPRSTRRVSHAATRFPSRCYAAIATGVVETSPADPVQSPRASSSLHDCIKERLCSKLKRAGCKALAMGVMQEGFSDSV